MRPCRVLRGHGENGPQALERDLARLLCQGITSTAGRTTFEFDRTRYEDALAALPTAPSVEWADEAA